jgi:hypothetical protein
MEALITTGYGGNMIVHHGVMEEKRKFIGNPCSPHALDMKIRDVPGPGK